MTGRGGAVTGRATPPPRTRPHPGDRTYLSGMSEHPEAPESRDAGEVPRRSPPRLAPGMLLAARDVLEDPHFRDTIVLLCQHGAEGAYGLVLNRPAHMPLREVFEHPPEGASGTRRVYVGGPVQSTELQILQVGEPVVADTMEVAPGVHLGGQWESLEEILAPSPERLRLFLGYAGWGDGQLEAEVGAGAWDVIETDVGRLLRAPETEWTGGAGPLRRFLATDGAASGDA